MIGCTKKNCPFGNLSECMITTGCPFYTNETIEKTAETIVDVVSELISKIKQRDAVDLLQEIKNQIGEIPVKAISAADSKTYTVYEVKDGNITIKSKIYPIKLQDGYYIIRKLTVSECKRLQTVPEWYEFPVSDTQAYKMLGNGWTVDVIAHLIQATKEDK